ncbi:MULTISPECIES: acidic tetraheme cytochrome c3 TmcA [unclassified Pseudodesulfovibrio]|uniref:acidic tetraheme cytochrome c3 TmcA n=1 Tax=unclassified Pseudodesulfovibrio TaxID=2661612 RepID=UPI000FEBB02F|nr:MULTISPECIES: cytochrome c3 family protein [unclassified Pseudodesulfovibrio]MCJ2164508.1 cytochrome c family protein [Pseudodesulfovibrio sp. S3-i]RWU04707.1 cytochrome C [Pseudodesulfovibrio sp. S3]
MHKRNTIKLAASMLTIILLVIAYMAPAAFAQDDMTMVPVDAFAKLERPQVPFAHDAHNEKAGVDDCVVCHHSKNDDGTRNTEESSEGETCASCHAVERTDGGTPLMRAYHQQCIDCHKQQAKGPVACGECHPK